MSTSRDVVIHAPVAVANVGPYGCHRYASQFLATYRTATSERPFTPVPFYLSCHALELALKAFLLLRKVPMSEIRSRKLGHDLRAILNRANGEGLGAIVAVSSLEEAELDLANDYYAQKGFEYFELRHLMPGAQLPNLGILVSLCERLLHTLEPLCKKVNP